MTLPKGEGYIAIHGCPTNYLLFPWSLPMEDLLPRKTTVPQALWVCYWYFWSGPVFMNGHLIDLNATLLKAPQDLVSKIKEGYPNKLTIDAPKTYYNKLGGPIIHNCHKWHGNFTLSLRIHQLHYNQQNMFNYFFPLLLLAIPIS